MVEAASASLIEISGVNMVSGIPAIDIWLVPWVNAIVLGVIAVVTVAITFLAGYYLAKFVSQVIVRVLESAKVEKWIDNHGLGDALFGFRLTQIIVLWTQIFIVVAAVGTGFALVRTDLPVVLMLNGFLGYWGGIPTGLATIVVALFGAKYISKEIKKGDIIMSNQIALAVYIAIAYLAAIMTLPILLPQAGDTLSNLLTYFLIAVVAGVGLAIGLAFGLGLKDVISKTALKNDAAIVRFFTKIGKK